MACHELEFPCITRKKRKPEEEAGAGEADSKKPRQGSLTDAQKTDAPSDPKKTDDPKAGGDSAKTNGHVNGTTNGDAKKEVGHVDVYSVRQGGFFSAYRRIPANFPRIFDPLEIGTNLGRK